MTIKELYKWAVENSVEDFKLYVCNEDIEDYYDVERDSLYIECDFVEIDI